MVSGEGKGSIFMWQ